MPAKANTSTAKRPAKRQSKVYDSDALDESDSNGSISDHDGSESSPPPKRRAKTRVAKPSSTKKRSRVTEDEQQDLPDRDQSTKASRTSPKKSPSKRGAKKRKTDDDFSLHDGQEIVGHVVQAPEEGRVPPGQISQNTLNFLSELKKPECNDREWFKLHEPVYRVAEQEWKDFVESFTDILTEIDPQIPPLPPKDVIHRIYRDMRFSNDKTPYKTGVSASFSRSGRKGIFAAYHIAVKSGNQSLIAGGSWCPAKNELATIRSNLSRSSARLRRIISSPDFEAYFGKAQPSAKAGERQNIFGAEDELKVAPKGFAKDHPDIDLLKCRSFAVVHRFLDSEVIAPDFKEKVGEVVRILTPFVHCLNDLMTIPNLGEDEPEDDEDEEEEEEEEGSEADEA